MTQKELDKIIKNHQHWLNKDCIGWENMKANLRGADLSNLSIANVDLRHACLEEVNLSQAILYRVSLNSANLRGANLSNACFTQVNLSCANLTYACIYEATFTGVSLYCADLVYTDLTNTKLNNVNLSHANLYGAKNIPFIPLICPEDGSFIGYKKAGNYIIKLRIPEDARRCSATTRKCRCDKAHVLGIQNLDGTIADVTEVVSNYTDSFIYRVGETVEEPDYCEDRWDAYAKGIYFFINRQEAVDWCISN